jgi:hypothetical protein
MSPHSSLTLLRIIAMLALLLGFGACHRTLPGVAASAAPAAAPALVGQWRNSNGAWRFQANGTFWFMGGTTIEAKPSTLAMPKTETLQGTYQVRGAKLHLDLKQHTPSERESTFQIDGRKLTIDGVVYDEQ